MPHWAAAFSGCLIRVNTYIKRIDRNDQTLMNMVSGVGNGVVFKQLGFLA
ncbi:hypothetical protein ABIE89_000602 [Bradyrhizobium niftali]